jgi:pimeloyl-ACP methyl ester carboxylesterase
VAFSIAQNALGALQLARETVESWRAPNQTLVGSCKGGDGAIVLLHGFAGTPRMLSALRTYLRNELDRPTLDIALGIGLGDIRDTAIRVHEAMMASGARHCDVIGYSLGGLVAAYLAKCLDQGRCIRRVVTLGAPHGGVSFLNQRRWLLARWIRSADQVRAGSPFLEQLSRMQAPAGTSMLSIAGADDTIAPPETAHLSGGNCRKLVVPGIDHWSLPTSRRVFRCVKEVLDTTDGSWPAPHLEIAPPSRPAIGFRTSAVQCISNAARRAR